MAGMTDYSFPLEDSSCLMSGWPPAFFDDKFLIECSTFLKQTFPQSLIPVFLSYATHSEFHIQKFHLQPGLNGPFLVGKTLLLSQSNQFILSYEEHECRFQSRFVRQNAQDFLGDVILDQLVPSGWMFERKSNSYSRSSQFDANSFSYTIRDREVSVFRPNQNEMNIPLKVYQIFSFRDPKETLLFLCSGISMFFLIKTQLDATQGRTEGKTSPISIVPLDDASGIPWDGWGIWTASNVERTTFLCSARCRRLHVVVQIMVVNIVEEKLDLIEEVELLWNEQSSSVFPKGLRVIGTRDGFCIVMGSFIYMLRNKWEKKRKAFWMS